LFRLHLEAKEARTRLAAAMRYFPDIRHYQVLPWYSIVLGVERNAMILAKLPKSVIAACSFARH